MNSPPWDLESPIITHPDPPLSGREPRTGPPDKGDDRGLSRESGAQTGPSRHGAPDLPLVLNPYSSFHKQMTFDLVGRGLGKFFLPDFKSGDLLVSRKTLVTFLDFILVD